ncbi:MAG: redoxin domain-containing protein [Planctomycetes bacterium]|nr:redoxin domain-containing protein [Planctomycetota bacterium]
MNTQPTWPRFVLRIAAIYNLLWGTWVILFPNHLFDWTGIARPNYPGIWQCVGMIVGVYGVGYWFAASDFRRHWPIVLVGFLGKIFGPIGFIQSALTGALPWSWGLTIVTNDLIWWIPFGAMLYLAFKDNTDPKRRSSDTWSLDEANHKAVASNGQGLAEISRGRDVLVVFLRHAGCTFCRETLDELSKRREEWTAKKIQPAVVHMGSPDEGSAMMARWGLSDIPHISDPECRLFQAYHLPRGTFGQLFGLRVWIEGFRAAILKGYGFGKLVGDGFQMSGACLIRDGRIVSAAPSRDAADSCPWKPLLAAHS